MRCIIQQHRFAEHCASLGNTDQHALALSSAQEINLALEHEPKPLAWGGFVKQVIARSVGNRCPALKHRLEGFGVDADSPGGVRDGLSINFHSERSFG